MRSGFIKLGQIIVGENFASRRTRIQKKAVRIAADESIHENFGSVDFNSGGVPRSTGSETQFSSTWGAGIKLFPGGGKVGARIAVRYTPTYVKTDAAGWWCDPYWGCYVLSEAQYANQFELAAGVSLRF